MIAALTTVFVLLLAHPAAAAALAGVVRDAHTARPLSGVLVELPELARRMVTDEAGGYRFTDVAVGVHSLRIRFLGYAEESLDARVPADGTLELDIALRPRPIEIAPLHVLGPIETGHARRDSPVSGGSTGRDFPIGSLRNNPLLTETDVLQAIEGGPVALRPESPDGLYLRGGAADQTAYLIDGFPVFNAFHAAGMSAAWNPDALERLRLASAGHSFAAPHALSGSVEAVTRPPGSFLGARGEVSSSQARMTLDGPVGRGGAGYVVSFRTGHPAAFAPTDPTYVRGGTSDGLAKVEVPLLTGHLRLLVFGSGNRLDAAAVAPGEERGPAARDAGAPATGGTSPVERHRFDWDSRSVGVAWRRATPRGGVEISGWSAVGESGATWWRSGAPTDMDAERRDLGFLATIDQRSGPADTRLGLRLERSRISYAVESAIDSVADWRVLASNPVGTLLARHDRPLGRSTRVQAALTSALRDRVVYLSPSARLERRFGSRLAVDVAVGRSHQFVQSLRNPESVVANLFPADLDLGAGGPAFPVARGDQAVLTAEWRPSDGWNVELEGYGRYSRGLVAVAPVEGAPFATRAPGTGRSRSHGASLRLGRMGDRLGWLAGYAWQDTRVVSGSQSYVPGHGTTHRIEGGVIAYPAPSLSIRVGAVAGFGRRATTIANEFEWESCNLADQGCEFGGSPDHTGERPGGARLPAYLRFDLGARKRWTIRLAGRETTVGLFGSITNLLNRSNVLTYSRDAATGGPSPVEMRSLSPLVVGFDWNF